MNENFPLVPGPNTLTATAIDTAGNSSVPFQIQITRQVLAGQRISSLNQATMAGVISAQLSTPLVALLTSASGNPVPGRNVTFRISGGDGTLASADSTGRSLTVPTDVNGQAQIDFTLGSRSGVGNQRVVATATGFAGEAEFMVSALAGIPADIKTYTGDTQAGAPGKPLPHSFIGVLHGSLGN